MKKFFKDKKNLIFVVLLGVALIGLLISSFWEGFMPISCILFGFVFGKNSQGPSGRS